FTEREQTQSADSSGKLLWKISRAQFLTISDPIIPSSSSAAVDSCIGGS
ncbi:unnamed protein product, partial [Linum tenue]